MGYFFLCRYPSTHWMQTAPVVAKKPQKSPQNTQYSLILDSQMPVILCGTKATDSN